MNEFLNTIGPWFIAAWGLVGWKGLGYLVAGVWLGDFLGRRYPDAWAWARAGLKMAGDKAKDAVKG